MSKEKKGNREAKKPKSDAKKLKKDPKRFDGPISGILGNSK
jgi:hypothetical protein